MAELAVNGGAPVRGRPFPARKPYGLRDAQQVLEALNNQELFFPSATKVYEFERRFAELYGVRYAVTSTSGTSAIHVALGAINADPGDEVITTPISDMGTVAPIILNNLIPVFADVELGTFNLDPDDVERKVTPRTRALIVVHCWGQPANMDRLLAIARRHNLMVVEDCAQAHLTHYRGRLAGTIGDLGSFSLQSSKHLQCGDGGVTITDDESLGERATLYVDKGCDWTKDRRTRLRYAFIAPCYRMTELQGAVLLSQLERLPWIVQSRQQLGDMLTGLLQGTPGVYPPQRAEGVEHSYWAFPIRVDEQALGISPEEFGRAVAAEGVPVGGAWIGKPLYMFEALAEQITYGSSHCPFDCPRASGQVRYYEGMCPTAELALKQLRTLPLNENYSEDDVRDIAEAVRRVAHYYAARHQG
jgi:dTDP-4-amino-4,6-dideoxygalactose transaminase